MKAVVAAFNQEKALVGAFSVIVQPVVELMDRFAALNNTHLLQLLLRLPELGEVEGGNLLRVLYLLLVGPRLVLELLHQLIQPLEVLLLLLPGELQLLDLPVSPQGSLVGLTRSVSSFIIPIHVVLFSLLAT